MHPGEEDALEDGSTQVQGGVERVGTNTAEGVGQGRNSLGSQAQARAYATEYVLLNADEGLTWR